MAAAPMDGPCIGMNDVSKDQLDRIEAKLGQVLALLTDEGAEEEQAEQRVVVTTMDGKRHEVAASPSMSMSRDRGGGA